MTLLQIHVKERTFSIFKRFFTTKLNCSIKQLWLTGYSPTGFQQGSDAALPLRTTRHSVGCYCWTKYFQVTDERSGQGESTPWPLCALTLRPLFLPPRHSKRTPPQADVTDPHKRDLCRYHRSSGGRVSLSGSWTKQDVHWIVYIKKNY